MKTIENTFVRDQSPSCSDEVNAGNVMSATLRIGMMQAKQARPHGSQGYGFYEDVHGGPIPTSAANTFPFWTIVVVLFAVAVGNLILTLTIVGVLHFGKGINGLELVPEEDATKFFGTTDFDRIYSKSFGLFEGFTDVPVSLTAEDGAVYVRVHHRNGQTNNRIIIDKGGVQFRAVNSFDLKDPLSGDTLFTTHRPHYNIPQGARALEAKVISASRITSAIDQPLAITSPDNRLLIKGSEGISLNSASACLQAEHNVVVNSTQGATILEAGSGIFLDMDKIPIVNGEHGLRTGSVQYKICACMPQGVLFRIAVPRLHNGPKISCAHFSSKYDPCSTN